ncbi:MFS family permease [Cerasibacillus quisquiliarum]|uniref:MFS transporter n=1 Tax=Cerasibacillus quisquiliarum TaxID=227865 RepID=A0A511UVZ6_9BACI|nr:MFS transporter [Cerasibacillus quisquiliarum]MBB5146074.1 MFS family permease [Cerasibacillus quisquiliarum]GEN30806.1 MFS transporter [Cerasibacillus quisquiliarum]
MSFSSKAESIPASEKIWTRDFILICIANFFVFIGFQMTLPTIPLFVKELGGSDQMIGIIVGIFTFSSLVIRPYAGHALETKGRRFVYLFGLMIFTISLASFAWIASIALLIIFRLIQGVGFGFTSTATGTIATDLIPPKRRGEGMGYFGLSGNLALALGPSLGLTLVGVISFKQLFLITAITGVIALLLATKIRYKKVEPVTRDTSSSFKFDVFEKTALNPSILLFFITISFGGIASFLPLYAAQKGVSGIEGYFLMYALFLMLSRVVAGRIYDLKGHIYVFLPGAILIFIALLLLSWLPNTLTLLLAAMIYGFGFGSVQPALQAWAVEEAAPNRKGMANATFFSSFDLGVGVGAIVFGQMAYLFNYHVIYLAAAGSVMIAIFYYMIILFLTWKKAKN